MKRLNVLKDELKRKQQSHRKAYMQLASVPDIKSPKRAKTPEKQVHIVPTESEAVKRAVPVSHGQQLALSKHELKSIERDAKNDTVHDRPARGVSMWGKSSRERPRG